MSDEIIARGIALILFLPLYLAFYAIVAAFDPFVKTLLLIVTVILVVAFLVMATSTSFTHAIIVVVIIIVILAVVIYIPQK